MSNTEILSQFITYITVNMRQIEVTIEVLRNLGANKGTILYQEEALKAAHIEYIRAVEALAEAAHAAERN